MALVPSTYHQDLSLTGRKWGDVEKEKQLEIRMKQLGLYEAKKCMESQLAQRLSSAIDSDAIMGVVSQAQARRRTRSLPDRAHSIVAGIKNVIRQKVVRDSNGRKVLYQVHILMGHFTKDVMHQVGDNEVIVTGTNSSALKLTKEIHIEFPDSVELSKVAVSYSAGVVKIEAPFIQVGVSSRQIWGSTNSEESMSFSSETDSDIFSLTPEPD